MQPTLSEIETLARSAGAILQLRYNQEHEIRYKGEIDLVTEADHASEAFLLEQIQARFPGGHIYTEESGEIAGRSADTWYIDPMDGTVNFSHHLPAFCVSIAFASNGIVTLGAVYDPLRDELFSAEYGKGAHLNGNRLRAAVTNQLRRSLLVTGFPYDVWDTAQNNFDNFINMAKLTQGVRCHGSAALDGCYVAAGRLDGFWELSLKPWDVAAAGLIALEAGACVTSVDSRANYLEPTLSILIAAPGIYNEMLKNLRL
jgi:myo-inositol-1(or 4)-monophosphatase